MALTSALAAASHAQVDTTEGLADVSGTPASSGQYSLCTTTAVFNFLTGALSGVQLTVPAPDASMFAADGVTIDPTSALAAAVIAGVIGFLTDSAGNVVTTYTTGVKSSRKVEQVG